MRIYGFVENNNLRQYKEVMIMLGRKGAKTTMLSCIELDLLMNDNEPSPEIYNVATAKEQARKGFIECHNMTQRNTSLAKHIRKRVADLYLTHNYGLSKALASNTNQVEGLNPHAVDLDDLAAYQHRDLYDFQPTSPCAAKYI